MRFEGQVAIVTGANLASPEEGVAALDAVCDRSSFATPVSIVEETDCIAADRPPVT